MTDKVIIAGDFGGTKTILSLATVVDGKPDLSHQRRFKSHDFNSPEELINKFLKSTGASDNVDTACLGIAGPVKGGKCRVTNLPWTIDRNRIEKKACLKKVVLINDFKSIAHGIPYLDENDYYSLNKGEMNHEGPIAIIGAGTGLGEGFAIYLPFKKRYEVVASEGGHSDFAPNNEEEVKLLVYLMKKFGHVSFERVLSGHGLVNIFNYLVDTEEYVPSSDIIDLINNDDPAAAISKFALTKRDELCMKTLDIFSSVYGAEAGNLALKFLPSGGLYIAGGIAPKILEILKAGRFMKSFLNKGRLSEFLENIPVRVILNEEVGLMGAAVKGSELPANPQIAI